MVRFVATQLGIRDTTSFARYAQRTATHREHASEIQKRYGYRPSSDPAESFQLLRWLYTRATLSAERPSVLFDRATARLVERKVLLPGVTVLERLVSSGRNRAVKRLWRLLSALPTPEQRATLDAMLLVPEGSRRSNLDRLRRSPTTISARALCQALERLSEIEKLGMSDLDFSRIPPGRVGALARQANAARAQAIMARMPDDRRIATLVAFVSRLERTACDDALNLMDLELAKLLTEADRAGKAKRKKTLQTFDQAAVLLRDALLIVLDPTQEDLARARPRATLRTGISRGARQGRCLCGSDRAAPGLTATHQFRSQAGASKLSEVLSLALWGVDERTQGLSGRCHGGPASCRSGSDCSSAYRDLIKVASKTAHYGEQALAVSAQWSDPLSLEPSCCTKFEGLRRAHRYYQEERETVFGHRRPLLV